MKRSILLLVFVWICFGLQVNAEDTTWQNDYDVRYLNEVNGITGNYIQLLKYKGTEESHVVPVQAIKDDITYRTYIDSGYKSDSISSIWKSNTLKELSFEPNILYGSNLSDLFYDCSSLEKLDVHNIDTSNATNMDGMFFGCTLIKSLDLENFDTSHNITFKYFFDGCSSLENLNIRSLDTSSAYDMSFMFADCRSLKNLNLDNFDTENASSMSNMFLNCESLESLDIKKFSFKKIYEINSMFSNCKSLKRVDFPKDVIASTISLNSMFSQCQSLETVDLSFLNLTGGYGLKDFFQGCDSLNTIITPLYISDSTGYDMNLVLPSEFHDENFNMYTVIPEGWSESITLRKGKINGSNAIVNIDNQIYTGKEVKPVPKVYIYGNLVPPSNYTVSYTNNINEGTATANIVFKGNFINSVKKNFQIKKEEIAVVEKNQSHYVAANKKLQLKVNARNVKITKIEWKSSNTKYATVNQKGVVKGKKAGRGKKVVITATVSYLSESVWMKYSQKKRTLKYTVAISKKSIKKITISGSGSVKAGKSIKLKANISPKGVKSGQIYWTCSNSRYATVKNGRVSTKKAGKNKKVTIKCISRDGSHKKASKRIKIK